MQFSSGPYYTPLDREFHHETADKPKLEKPIIPINELGITVVEKDPMTGGNIIQNVDAAIRQGTSTIQLVFNQQHNSPIGAGPKSYGKEVRENLRELARLNDVMIEGVEMPTSSMSNLSGFDPQRFNISEQKRQSDLQQVKDAIKFIGDVAGGGGVDIWSQEFNRNIVDASWNKKGKWADHFEAYESEDHYATEYLVDQRTGQVMQEIRHSSDIFEPVYREAKEDKWGVDRNGNKVKIKKGDWVDIDGNWINPFEREDLLHRVPQWDDKNKKFDSRRVNDWKEIEKRTERYNDRAKELGYDVELAPAEYAFRLQMENKWIQTRGQSLFYTRSYEDQIKLWDELKKAKEYYEKLEKDTPEEEMWSIMKEDPLFGRQGLLPTKFKKPTEIIKEQLGSIEHDLKHVHEASAAADANAEEVVRTMNEVTSLKKFAKKKAIESYAEAGIAALDETNQNRNVDRPVFVGPEIGWPTGYGGHPEEFIELIQGARNEMAKKLVKDRGFSKSEAKETAAKHLMGCFDTGHMGMWLQHFKKEHPQETEERRLKRFKGWYLDMTKKMNDAGVIGSIQAVDSATAGHDHLPAGQGILPVVEAVDLLKSNGWNGFVISEGHGEEQFSRGRIMLQTWRAFGSDIADSYFAPAAGGARWSDVGEQYFGHVNPPPYVIGNYRPTEDWVFWSGVPLE